MERKPEEMILNLVFNTVWLSSITILFTDHVFSDTVIENGKICAQQPTQIDLTGNCIKQLIIMI